MGIVVLVACFLSVVEVVEDVVGAIRGTISDLETSPPESLVIWTGGIRTGGPLGFSIAALATKAQTMPMRIKLITRRT